ncbi:DUF6443 domain-containing protein [Chryseobacterium sp. MYb264]|uniref:DUF6443 domain-containing protein n=1 Tax=Chryseobacterium sp. MYb264 TaxID=2745153 RepID=UPI002E0E8F34|nr:DUF6443 domain-containing protein [Chryseobacterium sp. MYb264]
MKKIFLFHIVLFVATLFRAQTSSENYVSSTTCLNDDCTKKTETVQYFDFLGRPKQVVNVKATPQGKDIVTPIVYDELGRQTRNYLPVPQSATSGGNIYPQTSGMVAYPIADITNIYGGEKIFTEKTLEKSPLERVLDQKQIGNAWNSKSTTFGYDLNNAADHVKKYEIVTSWDPATKLYKNEVQYTTSEYASGQLVKNTVIDEDGNTAVEFKDGSGQTILIRKVMNATKNADTYYLYNDYKQLAYVIPPLASSAALSSTAVETLCYQYKYDSKNRLVEKKLPGKGWELMVYDKQDRLILSQDAVLGSTNNNFSAKGWMFSKYDEFGRVVYTGFFANTASRIAMQTAINNMSANSGNNEKRDDTTPIVQNGENIYYTKNAFPTGSMTILSVNYYDTYPPLPQGAEVPVAIMGKQVLKQPGQASKNTKSLPLASYVRNVEDNAWTKSFSYYDEKGRVIGSYSINHLGGYTRTESNIDFVGLAKQTKVYHKRLTSDTEKVITQTFTYDDGNRLLVQKHKVDNNTEEILSQNEYNELSQLKTKKVGGTNIAQPLQSIDYAYNIRGWLTKINDPANLNGKLFGYEMRYTNPINTNIAPGKFGGNITEVDWKNATEDVLKRYTYAYDGLNRLQDAIYSEPNSTTPFNNNFNENLSYDLNGNIKTLKRNAVPISGNSATLVDDLIYEYTGNRLTKVVENALNDTGYEGGNNIISYDLNGNMKDMLDKGIQIINYNFLDLPNQLAISQTNPIGLVSSSNLSYLYRADGTKLRKTYVNALPKGIPITKITDYLDGFQYNYVDDGTGIGTPCITCRTENAYEAQAYRAIIGGPIVMPTTPEWKLDFVGTSEGFYSFTENRYIYQYKDHLGNARVSFSKNSAGVLETRDTNNFYPFGLNHIGGSNSSAIGSFYSYKYSWKELQETGFYDYGWRQYMPDLGRWGVMDQLSESYLSTSPYAYVVNNPIMFIDPDGRLSQSAMNQFLNSPSGTIWTNSGSGFSNNWGGSMSYDGNPLNYNGYSGFDDMPTINIPGINLIGKSSSWGSQVQNHFNSYMRGWNAKSDFAWDRILNAGRYNDGPIQYVGGPDDPFGIFEVAGMMLSSSDNRGMNYAAIPFLIITRHGDDALKILAAEKGILNAEAKAISKEAVSLNGTLTKGPFAGEGLFAKNGKSRRFTSEERSIMNEQGYTLGCHTCGQTSPGTKSGNFILDHQPANALIPYGWPQTFYPHCKYCSSSQGGIIGGMKKQGILPKISD